MTNEDWRVRVSWVERWTIAMLQSTPPDVLTSLCQDVDYSVSRNPNTLWNLDT